MRQLAAAMALSALAAGADAAGRVSLTAGSAEFDGLAVEGLEAAWAPTTGANGGVRLRAARVRGIAETGPLSSFALDCASLRISGDELSCEGGRLAGSLGSLGVQDTRFTARRAANGRTSLVLDTFSVAGGRGRVALELAGARWNATASLSDLEVAQAADVMKPWFALPEGFTLAGGLSGEFSATGRGNELQSAGADATFESLDFSDSGGTLAGEQVAGSFRVEATSDGGSGLLTRGDVALIGGQAYSDPVFLDFGAHRASVAFSGRLDTAALRLDAREFTLDHAGTLRAHGSATLNFGEGALLPEARVELESLNLAGALPVYAQPFLIDSAFRDVAGDGIVRGEVEIHGGLPARAALTLEDVAVESPTAAVALAGLRGSVNWFDDASRSSLAGSIDDVLFESRLAWDSGRLWGLELGAAELPFATTGRHFRLLGPTTIPIFDGGLAIDTLRVRHAGAPDMYVRFDAAIRPISVSLLSRAFGWPEFQGSLEGEIPGLQLREGVVTLDGALEARVFDGRVVVRELRLSEPLGRYPRLFANVGVENLDLELVTRTFEFGSITGRLSGYVSDLETFDWMPEAFDAFLYTPPEDRSRHRISQRAVTNLSSIGGGSGGGVAAALQGGFLRFFDAFGYDRLGLSCRLANDVCVMGGVMPAPGGYYIVKGAGLPRINVVGNQSRVAWTTLVRQLGAVMESEIVVQ
ncbi:MAG TPA: hypothetical protein VFR77_01470 [Steroidobacteraceae bacterium]|nr:hypothetical protein [Steroidobacteraceae bacterium]